MCSLGIFPLPGCVHPALTGSTWRTGFVPWVWVAGRKIFHFPHFPSPLLSPWRAGRGHSCAVTVLGHNLLLFSPLVISPFPFPNPQVLLTFGLPAVLCWEGWEGRAPPGEKGSPKHSWSPAGGCPQQGERSCESLAQVSPQGVQNPQIPWFVCPSGSRAA